MRSPASRTALTAAVALACAIGAAGCGKGPAGAPSAAGLGPGTLPQGTVTKNTASLGDGTPAGDAAAIARAVYPGFSPATRPQAVALVDAGDWRAALAAASLAAPPLRIPLLYSSGSSLPDASAQALRAMAPTGSAALGGAQVISVGGAPRPSGYRVQRVAAAGAPALASAVAALAARAQAARATRVVIAGENQPSYAMPAAGLAAESGAPLLFVDSGGVPAATGSALAGLGHPTLYVVGPDAAVSAGTLSELGRLGTVKRIRGADPVANSIAVAQYTDGSFGWGVVDPGHGLVFVRTDRPMDAAAAAPLSSSGDYGPTLLLAGGDGPPPALTAYLTAIQPGYTADPRFQPVRGVYNRGWLIGGAAAVSPATQARLDALLEISPRVAPPAAPATAP